MFSQSPLRVGENGGFANFREAARAVVSCLKDEIGLDLWMVTRVIGNDSVILCVESSTYNLRSGDVLTWDETICSRMVKELGPNIASDVSEIPSYYEVSKMRMLNVGSYVGMPIILPGGELFGTLSAYSSTQCDPNIAKYEGAVRLCARLLSTVLESEIERIEMERMMESSELETLSEDSYGLIGVDGWHEVLRLESGRCRSLAIPAFVMLIDSVALNDVAPDQISSIIRSMIIAIKTVQSKNVWVAHLSKARLGVLVVGLYGFDVENFFQNTRINLMKLGFDLNSSYRVGRHGQSLSELYEELSSFVKT